jgi:acylglycerol lipase
MKQYYLKSLCEYINIFEGVDINDCKGIILNLHGLGTHFQFIANSVDSVFYRDEYFSSFNYKTFAMEFRGHGKSSGTPCAIYSFNDLLIDLVNIIKLISSNYPNKKIFIIAESMGGAVALKYALNNINIAGIILLSPMYSIDETMIPSPFMVEVLNIVSRIIPWLPYGMTKNITESSITNETYKQLYYNSPYTFKGKYPLCTLREMYLTSIELPTQVHQLNTPTIIFHGDNDNIIKLSGSEELYGKLKCKKKLIVIPNRGHNLMVPKSALDKTPNKIYQEILEWMEEL